MTGHSHRLLSGEDSALKLSNNAICDPNIIILCCDCVCNILEELADVSLSHI
jgi:hypothetical protein